MAIIGAVVGAGAVYGIATADPHSDYSAHNDYDDYDDYDDYSDAAERRRRRQEAKEKEIDNKKYEINTYKSQNVNAYLQSQNLIKQSGVDVSVTEVKDDGDKKLKTEAARNINQESNSLQAELRTLDNVIAKIDIILEEK